MQYVWHQLLKPRVLDASDALRALKIRRSLVATRLTLARIVNEELSHLAKRAALLAIVDNEAGAAALGLTHAFLDAVRQIGAAGADIRTEHIRAVALIMHAAR